MRVYIIRHGESENNARNCWTGWMDVSLTAKGEEDAKKAGRVLEGVVFDRVFSSDLIRAKKTAAIALPGASIEPLPLLREINVGSIAGRPIQDLSDEEQRLTRTEGYQAFGGESRGELRERIRRFLQQVEELNCPNVAAFSHAGFLMGMMSEILGMPFSGKKVFCGNCAVAVFERTPNGWRLHSWINHT